MKPKPILLTSNRTQIRRLRDDLERRTRAHFADARLRARATLDAFAEAYGRELQRLQQQAKRDGKDPQAVRVPLHWLTTSGWKLRVQVVLQDAAETAAERSLADLQRAQRQAAQAGNDEAQRLLQRALAPAQRAIRDVRR